MVKRSLQASAPGIQVAKRAFAIKGWTQENLAGEVNLKTRQPIWRFFTGKPVDRQVFMEICSLLDLDWREIAENPPAEFPEPGKALIASGINLDNLVEQVRSQRHDTIQNRCGIIQLLDIGRPVNLDDIYVDVNILEELAHQRWQAIEELQKLAPAEFDRVGMGAVNRRQMAGTAAVETYKKLRVLGKPGIGKTTFLQHLAIQCDGGHFIPTQVPIFIALRDFAEESRESGRFSLLDYIRQLFVTAGIPDPSTAGTLLRAGRILLLLDGMDEVINQDMVGVSRDIRKFSQKYHQNQIIVTCRTAFQNPKLHGFTDVEIAPFTQEQINVFVKKWFTNLGANDHEAAEAKSVQLLGEIDHPENWKFRQLIVNPLFLHVACWVFQCQGKLPAKRTDFYKQGLDLLLYKWDESKGVERDRLYRGFLLPEKIKLLSQLAAVTFEKGEYFFEQRVIERYIEDYLCHLPGHNLEPEQLQLESEAMLRTIENQHGLITERTKGIFSFSYLAFQEYLTARKIVASHNLRALENALEGLVSHIEDPHWREVFLLTTTMLRSADSLVQLMKQQIDVLVSQDPYLQEFLTWASQKSQNLQSEPKVATSRAFYLALAQSPHIMAHFNLAATLDQGLFLDAALDHLLLECSSDHSSGFAHAHACGEALNQTLTMILDAGLYKSLEQLQEQLPMAHQTPESSQSWWQEHCASWTEQLKSTIAKHRNYSSWDFTPDQHQILQGYYDANQLLLDCLNSNCEITAAVRQNIEATLLLPQGELEEREWN
ncbi:MAG: NACHT domain-containing protein [Spirulina sp. DLM2.Bin59]|nr:MAG: NACHT domain-containing protein [Spirulina sp. DLM2.Bin59]